LIFLFCRIASVGNAHDHAVIRITTRVARRHPTA
jgi:hypothetical protein